MRMRWLERAAMNNRLRAWMMKRYEAPRVLGDLALNGGDAVLEIGCGGGEGVLLLNRFLSVERVVGIDVDPRMIAHARRKLTRPPRWSRNVGTDNIRLLLADAARMPFADARFDAVCLFGVLHHITEWRRCLSEVHRVLKPGGVLSFMELAIPNHPLALSRFLNHVSFGHDELKRALVESGFRIERFDVWRMMFCFVRALKSENST